MSSSDCQARLRDLAQRLRERLEELLQIQLLLRGSFHCAYSRCGKPNCWCASHRRGHPHTRLTWSDNGQMTTRTVPAQAIERVSALTHSYRQFTALRRKLRTLYGQMESLLDQHEHRLITQAQKPLRAVGFTAKMSPRRPPGRQNRQARAKDHG